MLTDIYLKAKITRCDNEASIIPVRRSTKRAPDVWDSAAFSSIFLASSFSCSQVESTPAHQRLTQTVGRRWNEL